MFQEEFTKKLENQIKNLEGISSVEIVPVFLTQSSSYRYYKTLLSLFALFIPTLVVQSMSLNVVAWKLLVVTLLAFFLASLLLRLNSLLVTLVPLSYRRMKVENMAYELFLRHEVFATHDRTGLLILVSQLEKAVYLLADKGLVKKIPTKKWQELSFQLAKDFNKNSPGESFLQALTELESELAEKFPVRSDDTNELSDHLRH